MAIIVGAVFNQVNVVFFVVYVCFANYWTEPPVRILKEGHIHDVVTCVHNSGV